MKNRKNNRFKKGDLVEVLKEKQLPHHHLFFTGRVDSVKTILDKDMVIFRDDNGNTETCSADNLQLIGRRCVK